MTIDGVILILHHLGIQPEAVLDLCNNLDVPMIVAVCQRTRVCVKIESTLTFSKIQPTSSK
jgi:hypothetical protein